MIGDLRALAVARSAGEALRDAEHPWGPTILDWIACGRLGSLDDALGLSDTVSKRDRLARRDALLQELFARFSHLPKHDQFGAAYNKLETYWKRHWEHRRSVPGGGFERDSLDHLCWRIFDLSPHFFSRRHFQRIVRA